MSLVPSINESNAPPELVFGRYRIEALIGRGSHGDVFVARVLSSGERVAIKVANSNDGERQARFDREARLLARVVHDNVVSVLDWGLLDDGRPALVMELVDGEPLDFWWSRARGEADWRTAAALMVGVLDALAALHEANVIHRDVKPANILVLRGRAPQVKLIDLGIGREEVAVEMSAITVSGQVLGTLAYMAPEQLLIEPLDSRVDIYAAGCVLYELLFARLPYLGTRMQQALARCAAAGPASIPPLPNGAAIPEALTALVLSMLRRAPDERPSSAARCAQILRELLSHDDDSASL
ncbi:MAG: serine/threonine-protein kinase [Polyangiales bacterium]